MIGVQLASPGAEIVDKCLARGLRINCTNNTVLRFMPAMIVTKEQIDEAINILDSVMGEKTNETLFVHKRLFDGRVERAARFKQLAEEAL